MIQFNAPQKLRQPQSREYHELQNASRYYEELTRALVINKNQLHRNLQSTFPQLESLLSVHLAESIGQLSAYSHMRNTF